MTSLNISLPESLRSFVDRQIEGGGYGTAFEYIRELLRREREGFEREVELRALIRAGIGGELEGKSARELTDEALEELFREIRATVKKRLTSKTKAK